MGRGPGNGAGEIRAKKQCTYTIIIMIMQMLSCKQWGAHRGMWGLPSSGDSIQPLAASRAERHEVGPSSDTKNVSLGVFHGFRKRQKGET